MKKIILIVLAAFAVLLMATRCNGSGVWKLPANASGEVDTSGLTLENGELISIIVYDDIAIVKSKIEPSFTDQLTVVQNYTNVYNLISENGFDSCTELQYWAVADMKSGSENKVISFTAGKSVFDAIENDATGTMIGDYVDDLWVHPSLLQ